MAKKFMKEIKILLLGNKRIISGYDYATKHGARLQSPPMGDIEKIRVYNTEEETEETFTPSEYVDREEAAKMLIRDYIPAYMMAELHAYTANKYL